MGIVAARADGVGTVALDGEARADALAEALAGLAETDARAVLVEAPAGASLDAWAGERVRWLWRDFPPPTVFAFEGHVAGALAAFALGCDIRVCGEGASIDPGTARDGLTLERARTLLRLAPGEAAPAGPMAAGEMLARGLASRMAPAGEALAAGRTAAAAIAARGPMATRLAKEAVWRGLPQPLEQALRFETDLTLLLQTTKDRAEGVRAFLEKRPPRFTGE